MFMKGSIYFTKMMLILLFFYMILYVLFKCFYCSFSLYPARSRVGRGKMGFDGTNAKTLLVFTFRAISNVLRVD